jgi:hypothetical protein
MMLFPDDFEGHVLDNHYADVFRGTDGRFYFTIKVEDKDTVEGRGGPFPDRDTATTAVSSTFMGIEIRFPTGKVEVPFVEPQPGGLPHISLTDVIPG